ncbi:family 4 glycosyl hydrolase [Paenibacillus cremeus]|nr:alpha-glucosidase/alpha-galactosidase [Paenibacillus cremeus]
MKTSVKIAIIGAGSAQFSAEIVRDLCVNPGLQGSHVVLMDIHEQRLEMVHRLAERLTREIRGKISFSKTTHRETALQGADFVINTAQVGGHDWTEAQRRLAEKHGYYRGARLHDFPQMALFLDVARDVERICPNAWLIQSANPVFEGCTLMHRETKVKVLGLCHGHYGYQHIARVLGLDPAYVTAETKGFNHWIWMTDFRYKGQDAYPLLNEWIEKHAEAYWAQDNFEFHDTQLSRAAIDQYRLYGLMPIGDTPRFVGWWYHTDLAAKQQWYGKLGGFDSELGWQRYLNKMNENVKKIERVVLDESQKVTDIFRPVQGHEQIVPIINSLVNDEEGIYQVNIPNKGQLIQGFPEDLVIECKGVVNASGIRGVVTPPLPAKVVVGEMVPRWRKAECAVEAMRSGDRDYLLQYLLHDQRTRTREQAEALITEWLSDSRNEKLARLFHA